jgi:hypothetical protein
LFKHALYSFKQLVLHSGLGFPKYLGHLERHPFLYDAHLQALVVFEADLAFNKEQEETANRKTIISKERIFIFIYKYLSLGFIK